MKTLHIPEPGDKLLYDGQVYVIEDVDFDDGFGEVNYTIRFKTVCGFGKAYYYNLTWNGEVFIASGVELPIHGPFPKPRMRSVLQDAFEKAMRENKSAISDAMNREIPFDEYRAKAVAWLTRTTPDQFAGPDHVDQIEVEGEE